MEKYDVIVIGGGPGGYPAAIRAAQLGARTALIEQTALGGTCLNWGCIPTKTLLASAGLFHALQNSNEFGVQAERTGFDYAAMVRRKDEIVGKLRNGIQQLLKANHVDVFTGIGRFDDRRHVAVVQDGKATAVLETDRIIIATGSISAWPSFLPRAPQVFESRAFLALTELPRTLVVMGGGIIGCEIACLAAQLGAQITIVEMLDDILMMLDDDVRKELRRHFEKNLKIRVLTGTRLESAAVEQERVRLKAGGENLEAEGLLVAVGRVPFTEGLNLAAAGLATDARGFLPVDENYRTKAANIFAIGDVNGGPQLAHAATAQGIWAAEVAVTGKAARRRQIVPNCIFTAPEVGTVGLTEKEAAEKKISVITGKFLFAALGKALAGGHAAGFVKLIAEAATGQVVGAAAVGAHATELIAEAALAVQNELTVDEIGRTIHAHPTLSEAWMEAAHAARGHCIHAPPRRSARAGKQG